MPVLSFLIKKAAENMRKKGTKTQSYAFQLQLQGLVEAYG